MKYKILIALSIFPSAALACLEKPKSIYLSETTYVVDADLTYGLNCFPSLTISNGDKTYTISQKSYKESNIICLTTRDEKKGSSSENCKNQSIPLINKDGRTTGHLVFAGSYAEILSNKSGATHDLPYFRVDFQKPEKWQLHAMRSSAVEIGSAELESTVCDKDKKLEEPAGAGDLNLRGKTLVSSSGGCASGLKESTASSKRPVFKIEREGAAQ